MAVYYAKQFASLLGCFPSGIKIPPVKRMPIVQSEDISNGCG